MAYGHRLIGTIYGHRWLEPINMVLTAQQTHLLSLSQHIPCSSTPSPLLYGLQLCPCCVCFQQFTQLEEPPQLEPPRPLRALPPPQRALPHPQRALPHPQRVPRLASPPRRRRLLSFPLIL